MALSDLEPRLLVHFSGASDNLHSSSSCHCRCSSQQDLASPLEWLPK